MDQTRLRLHELDRDAMLKRDPMKIVYRRSLKARKINQVRQVDLLSSETEKLTECKDSK